MNNRHLVRGTVGFLWLLSMALVLGGCVQTSQTPSSAGSTPTAPVSRPSPSPPPSSPAPCQTSHLLLAFDKGGAALGNAGAQLVFVNQAKENCTLMGYPALQLLDARHQLIRGQVGQATAAYLYTAHAPHQFVLQAGGRAYFVVEWANLGCGKIPPASYASQVSFLQVTPPLNQTSLLLAIQFCALRNFVEISPLEPDKVLGIFV